MGYIIQFCLALPLHSCVHSEKPSFATRTQKHKGLTNAIMLIFESL